MAPWADALFAMDVDWWRTYAAEVKANFRGQRFSSNKLPAEYEVKHLLPAHFKAHHNSGCGAIALAVKGGARRVLMLGYDCQKTGGKAHWHADYAKLGNAGSIDKWPARFQSLADDCRGVEIINCSRETALEVFPRMSLEEALEQVAA
jgi:hypothetical protein